MKDENNAAMSVMLNYFVKVPNGSLSQVADGHLGQS